MLRPYIIKNSYIIQSLYADCESGVVPEAYSDSNGNIYVVTDDDYGFIYSASDGHAIDNIDFVCLHVATRKEIKAAGLWDYVTNKDDYSSEEDKIDTELDEYLRIGEEIEKERGAQKDDKSS